MSIYYAVDRRGLFKPDSRFDLSVLPIDTSRITPHAATQFNSGISPHGITYFIGDNIDYHVHNRGNQPASAIEYALELVRQAHYPEKPSRFQSMFGCETLDGAKHFRGQYDPYKISTPIYEIIPNEKVHRGDMNLLSAKCPISELDRRLRTYWSEGSYPLHSNYEPFWEIVIPLPVNIGARAA